MIATKGRCRLRTPWRSRAAGWAVSRAQLARRKSLATIVALGAWGCAPSNTISSSEDANLVVLAANRSYESIVSLDSGVGAIKAGEWTRGCLEGGSLTVRRQILERDPGAVRFVSTVTYDDCIDQGVALMGVLVRHRYEEEAGNDGWVRLKGFVQVSGEVSGRCFFRVLSHDRTGESDGKACGFEAAMFEVSLLY